MRNGKMLKKILIPVCVLLVLTTGLGIWYAAGHSNSEPVNAYPFYFIGMTEYWGDSQESYGPVSTDKIQTIYLSDTQTVTQILVNQGDTVKKGDLLMTFDTTLSDLALERERLAVEKLKLQLESAKKQLREINAMKPMKIPTPSDDKEEETELGTALKDSFQISTRKVFDGSTREKALICWIKGKTQIEDRIFEAIRLKAEEYQRHNAAAAESEPAAASEETTEPFLNETEIPDGEDTTEPPTEEPAEPELTVDKFYVVFKVTQKNMSLGQTLIWQGMEVTRNPADNRFGFRLFDASGFNDHMKPKDGDTSAQRPEIDFGSGYTASQIAQMRSEQEKTIKDLQFQIKMAEAEYKIKQTEVSDGNVYAEIDGQVVSVLTEEEARMNMQPIVKVSGGGGFYVQGSVSELEKDTMRLGQEVTVNDWNTGMVYVGTIRELGDFPAANGYWNGMGNPNASYYPFTVYIDGSADLQEGSYVSVVYSSGEAMNGIYLENPYLRTEQGKSYVYVLGADGKLEQRFVTTGKSLWGSYTEILDGLTAEDYVAFPYGKNVRPGVDAVACEDMSQLWG